MKKENYPRLSQPSLSFLKTTYFLFLFFIIPLTSIAQEKKVENFYIDYFNLPRESLFLHTNKTTYVAGESEAIWFTAYAYDRKSHLSSKATTNIRLGLYNSKGEVIKKQLLRATNGMASGHLELEPTLKTGDYYLKIHTQWMQNFKEDDSFVTKIRVINVKDPKPTDVKQLRSQEYDIQFLPEGGHLLSGVKNNVGIKALDDYGKGSRLTGVILDANDIEIASIKTNFLGLGKFSFIPKKGVTYRAKITLENSKELVLELPKVQEEGITIRVNNFRKDQVMIDLVTNETSFKTLQGKPMKLLIHQNGTTKIFPVAFNAPVERISIAKNLLFKGVNTITLFDENTPILERMFFNEAPIVDYQIAVDSWESEGDSLRYQLKSQLQDSTILSASISVLPKGTKSYNPRHSIVSAFYLQPHLKGFIENPRYYFENVDRKKKFALDLLLLTQGWSRYDWQDIFQNPPSMRYEFENGITINGNLNDPLSKDVTLFLYPTRNNESRFINFNEKGKFQIKNYFPLVDEKLKFSIINKRGKAKRPKMAVNSLVNWKQDRVDTTPFQEYASFYNQENRIPENFLNKNEVLDEIVISSRLDRVFNKKGPKFEGSIIKITDSVVRQSSTIEQILAQEKFFIVYNGPDLDIIAKEKVNKDSPRPVVFFVDGAPIMNTHMFLTSGTAQYEDVYIDYSYNNVNVVQNGQWRSLNRAIIVNLFGRITPFEDPDLNGRSFNNMISLKHGFEAKKEFYTPRYIDYQIPAFKEYGVIHWEPNLSIQQGVNSELTTINTGLDKVNLYIEGIASDGSIFSQTLQLNKTAKK